MTLENKLGITDSVELAKAEEKISKKRAIELFESGYLNNLEAGTFKSLAEIHKYLFDLIYDFAGQISDYYGVADQVFWFKLIINSDKTDQSFRLGWPTI